MLKIGDFSKLAQVSVKTLRHYGKLGLLRPAWIDRYTGYRYYSLDQLPRLNRILALKDLGFSLEQIKELLRDDLPAAELRGMMRIKHADLERQVQAEQARLARVEARLVQIEQEGKLPQHEVVLKPVAGQRVAGIRDVVPTYLDVERLIGELHTRLPAQAAVDATCPCLAIYYDTEYHDRGVDVEVAAPFARRLPATLMPRVAVHELPRVETMAYVIHQGGHDTLPEAYNTLMGWIESNGYRVAGPNRDVYLQGPESGLDAAHYVTEVQFPVEKKPMTTFVAQNKEKDNMEPQIVTKPAFTVVGLKYCGLNKNNEIAQMWQKFIPRLGEIKHGTGPHVTYGVCCDQEGGDDIEYIAGVEVDSLEDIPTGMASMSVPEQKYAIFPCTLQTIHQAYQHAFQTWLPQSGYHRANGPDFEFYDDTFESLSVMYIYVPIK